jgi:hypothetical protein
VRVLFGKARGLNGLHLYGLGLNDSHCHAIAEALRAPYMNLEMLKLCLNPDISAQGYGSLLSLVNRSNAIDKWTDPISTFCVDDKHWEAKLNLVSEMNRHYGRREYMTDGAFTSEEHRWQWLKKLATLPSSSSDGDEEGDIEYMEYMDEEDAKQVNFIWYELLEHPEFMQT